MPTKKRVVLVGCGGISNAWFNPSKKFGDEIEFVGLVDLKIENAEKRKEEHGLTKAVTGTDLAEVLKQTKPDAVFDCTVPTAHCGVTVTALNHGCHILGEKPMAESMDEAHQMVNAAKENDKTYAVIQNRRYLKNMIQFRDLLKKPELGDLTTLDADFYIGAHFGGFREQMDHVLLIDMAIHSFDQARFISGKDPVAVYAHEWNPKGSWFKHGASVVCIFEMSDGVVFTYRGSWCSEGKNTSWNCDWRAICEKGSITCVNDELSGEMIVEKDDAQGFRREGKEMEIPELPDLEFPGHTGLIRDFLDSLDSDKEIQTVCTDNIKSLAMVLAAVESAETGKKIQIKY